MTKINNKKMREEVKEIWNDIVSRNTAEYGLEYSIEEEDFMVSAMWDEEGVIDPSASMLGMYDDLYEISIAEDFSCHMRDNIEDCIMDLDLSLIQEYLDKSNRIINL